MMIADAHEAIRRDQIVRSYGQLIERQHEPLYGADVRSDRMAGAPVTSLAVRALVVRLARKVRTYSQNVRYISQEV